MSLFSSTILGIDIGYSTVKVVGVSSGPKPKFIGCKEIHVDPELLSRDGFQKPEVIAAAINQAMNEAAPKPLKKGPAYVALPESITFRKILEIPYIEEPELCRYQGEIEPLPNE